MGKPATRAQNKYISKAYDRINLIVPKGDKEKIKESAERAGVSVNSFINNAIQEKIEKST